MKKIRLSRLAAILAVICVAFLMVSQPLKASGQGKKGPKPSPSPTVSPTPPSEPPARFWHMLSSTNSDDAAMARVYMFGGEGGAENGWLPLDDLWYYDVLSGTWKFVAANSASRPSGTGQSAFACSQSGCLMVGGNYSRAMSETWYFRISDSTWTGLNCRRLGCPPDRRLATAAWDESKSNFVLFGGFPGSYSTTLLSDTWTFDGSRWTQRSPSNVPQDRGWSAMASVTATGGVSVNGVVLFGGLRYRFDGTYNRLSEMCDMHLWNGTDWQQIKARGEGPCLYGHSMFQDFSSGGKPQLKVVSGYRVGRPENGDTECDMPSYQTWVFTFESPTSGYWTLETDGNTCISSTFYPGSAVALDRVTNQKIYFGGVINQPGQGAVAYSGFNICY